MLRIDELNKLLRKCQKMLEEHPEELKTFMSIVYDLVHIALYVGYIRGRQGRESIDPEELFNELFNKFLTDEWKHLDHERQNFFLDEDFFNNLKSDTLALAESLFPIVMKLYAKEETCEAEKR